MLEIQPELLLQKLNEQLPEDVQFTNLRVIDRKADSLFQLIDTAEYVVRLDSDRFSSNLKEKVNGELDGELTAMHERLVKKLLAKETVEITKISKGRERTQDVRPMIKNIQVLNTDQPLQLRMKLATGGRGSVRPDVVLRELYGDLAEFLDVRRERLLVESDGEFLSPFEVD